MKKIADALEKMLKVASVCILVLLVIVVSIQIFARYVLNHSLSWSEELVRYLFIYLIFLGASIVYKQNKHISVSYFFNQLPARMRSIISILVDLLLLIFLLVVFHQGLKLSSMVHNVLTAALNIPWMYVYLAIVLGSGSMVIFTLIFIYHRIRKESP
jgi:TRAP-type C4-dicarboxylate transport system permease small subunit